MTERRLYDGFVMLDGGMDGATPPDDPFMLNRTALAVNCTHRGGYPQQRPGLVERTFDFEEDEELQVAFEQGLFQGASVYYPDNGPPALVASVSGHLYKVEPWNDYKVSDVSVPGDYDNSLLTHVWFFQAERWLIKQDGIDAAVIFDGGTSRRPGLDEIKPGRAGVYAWGRIWYALPDGRRYRATDMVYGNGNREDVLKETENVYLTGADFAVPASAGQITALVVPGMLDNGTGQGPVHVFTETAVFSCNAPVDRDVWLDLTNPIQTVSLNQYGALGDRNCVVINGDIFFRAVDGIRSYAVARRNFGSWANTSISREVERFIKNDNGALLGHGSAVLYDNRLLMTCAPRLIEGQGVVHSGLVVMDFDPISTFSEQEPPVWDGLWTGLNIHQVLVSVYEGKQRCWAFARNDRGVLELWEFDPNKYLDNEDNEIEWLVVPRQMAFGEPMTLKKLIGGELFIDQLRGEVDFNVTYKPDDYPVPQAWAIWSECANVTDCGTDAVIDPEHPYGCITLQSLQPQYRTRMQLPQPDDTCNESVDRNMRTGYKFQPIILVRGACRLKMLRLKAMTDVEPPDVKCGAGVCKTIAGCDIDPFDYQADA